MSFPQRRKFPCQKDEFRISSYNPNVVGMNKVCVESTTRLVPLHNFIDRAQWRGDRDQYSIFLFWFPDEIFTLNRKPVSSCWKEETCNRVEAEMPFMFCRSKDEENHPRMAVAAWASCNWNPPCIWYGYIGDVPVTKPVIGAGLADLGICEFVPCNFWRETCSIINGEFSELESVEPTVYPSSLVPSNWPADRVPSLICGEDFTEPN